MRKREGNKNVKLYMLGNKENKKGKRIGKKLRRGKHYKLYEKKFFGKEKKKL